MRENDIDRIDLQYKNNPKKNEKDMLLIDKYDNKFYLNPQLEAGPGEGDYIYNVGPSIWKISTLMEIMNHFKNETYRTIEMGPTQIFCKDKGYKIIKEE